MANVLVVAGPGSKYQVPGAAPAGFWAGLWHGMISPITFIVSLFTPCVRIYETRNRGRWYDGMSLDLFLVFLPHLVAARDKPARVYKRLRLQMERRLNIEAS